MGDYKKLRVWEEAKNLAVKIYRITDEGKFSKDFRLKDQIRAAAVSIPSNIAEGDELGTTKQSIRHFYIARGSLAELDTQLVIALEIGYIQEEEYQLFSQKVKDLSVKLRNLISYRSKNHLPP